MTSCPYDEFITRVENELNNSTSTDYRCIDGTVIHTDVGYVEDWFKEWKKTLPKSAILNTRLNDEEKESLLKFFLTHCLVEQLDESGTRFEVKFFNNPDNVTKNIAVLMSKAMMNLQKGVWGL